MSDDNSTGQATEEPTTTTTETDSAPDSTLNNDGDSFLSSNEDASGETPQESTPQTQVAERPEFINESHWDAEKGEVRTEALAKSFKDTKAALDKKKDESGVPEHAQQYFQTKEDGSLFIPEELTHLPQIQTNDVILTKVSEAALAQGVSKDQMGAIIQAYFEGNNQYLSQFAFDEDAERAKVDPDPVRSKHVIEGVNVYFSQLDLAEGEQTALKQVMASGEGINLLNKVMGLAGKNAIATGAQVSASPDTTALKAEWDALRKDPGARDRDPMKQRRFEEIGTQIHG